MSVSIIPQNFKFEKPTIKDGFGNIRSVGMNVSIDIDIQRADKSVVKSDLETIFAEVLEYFD